MHEEISTIILVRDLRFTLFLLLFYSFQFLAVFRVLWSRINIRLSGVSVRPKLNTISYYVPFSSSCNLHLTRSNCFPKFLIVLIVPFIILFASLCHFLITRLMLFNTLFMIAFLFCTFVLYFVYSVFLFCAALCIVCPFVYSCLFPNFVQVYRPLPSGGNPIAVNKYLLTYCMEQSPSWEANWFCS